jgi:hypothetical protein
MTVEEELRQEINEQKKAISFLTKQIEAYKLLLKDKDLLAVNKDY